MGDIQIRYATDTDLPYLQRSDDLVSELVMRKKVSDSRVIVAVKDGSHLGWLRFGFWWDLFPFMNLIVVEEEARGKGTGRKLVEFWEKEMKAQGHNLVITSTDANEDAQRFHRKMGYRDSGCILFPKELFPASTLEILLLKVLK
ncbi:GNAT family N-acetyltransferase [Chloroflexota bacterium]